MYSVKHTMRGARDLLGQKYGKSRLLHAMQLISPMRLIPCAHLSLLPLKNAVSVREKYTDPNPLSKEGRTAPKSRKEAVIVPTIKEGTTFSKVRYVPEKYIDIVGWDKTEKPVMGFGIKNVNLRGEFSGFRRMQQFREQVDRERRSAAKGQKRLEEHMQATQRSSQAPARGPVRGDASIQIRASEHQEGPQDARSLSSRQGRMPPRRPGSRVSRSRSRSRSRPGSAHSRPTRSPMRNPGTPTRRDRGHDPEGPGSRPGVTMRSRRGSAASGGSRSGNRGGGGFGFRPQSAAPRLAGATRHTQEQSEAAQEYEMLVTGNTRRSVTAGHDRVTE